MIVDIRPPGVMSGDTRTQLEQLRRYLYGLSEQLNLALSHIEKTVAEGTVLLKEQNDRQPSEKETQDRFNAIKALIVKSADIVNAYSDEISKRLEGLYVAQSEFGEFREKTAADLKANSTSIDLLFKNTQSVLSDVSSVKAVLSSNGDGTTILGAEAWAKIGLLEYDASTGFPVYGMEVGQVNEQNGQTVLKKFAQYRSDGVHLYDENGTKVAWISQGILHITRAEIESSLKLGGFLLDASNGLALKWVGR